MGCLGWIKQRLLRLSLVGLGMVALPARESLACAVCGFGEDKSSQVFLYSTMVLSLVPLGLIGGILYWLYRSTKRREL
jgi:hypothetical protein